MTLHQLVLLPGLDGTGQMFADFVAALPHTVTPTIVAYPTNRSLSYIELLHIVGSAVPSTGPFVVLAESFSTPLAVHFAATNPPNLAAVIICAGFVVRPVGGWSRFAKAIAKPWFFRLRPPRLALEYFLAGENASSELIQQLRHTLMLVRPEVLSSRVQEALICDARNDFSRVKVPIMYLHATHDKLLSRDCAGEILRLKPDIVFVTIEGPHLLLQRESQKAAALVAAFMEQVRA